MNKSLLWIKQMFQNCGLPFLPLIYSQPDYNRSRFPQSPTTRSHCVQQPVPRGSHHAAALTAAKPQRGTAPLRRGRVPEVYKQETKPKDALGAFSLSLPSLPSTRCLSLHGGRYSLCCEVRNSVSLKDQKSGGGIGREKWMDRDDSPALPPQQGGHQLHHCCYCGSSPSSLPFACPP